MYHRRRRSHSSSTPTPPSQPALNAATTVYHPPLAAAAAGAALRHAVPSPTPTPVGSIPTKRMVKRHDSYSSDMQRASSTSSLTERRFRKERGSIGTSSRRGSIDTSTASRRGSANIDIGRRASTGGGSRTGSKIMMIGGNNGNWDKNSPPGTPLGLPRKVTAYHEEGEDSSDDDASDDSLGLPLPPRSPSLRQFPTTLRNGGGAKKQRTRDISSSSSSADRSHRRSTDYDSSASLSSIAEDSWPRPAAPLPPKIPEESSSSGDDGRSKRTLLSLPRHNPPGRSASPVKSALKHAAPSAKPRVSFSDEDSLAGFTPPRPFYGGIRAPSPPPSDSEDGEIMGLESALLYPRGQPPLGAGSVVKRLLSEGLPAAPLGGRGPLTPPGTRAGTEVPEVRVVAATPNEERGMGSVLYESDSDTSGDSIYSDAFENLPMAAAPFGSNGVMPGILEVAPPPPPPPPPPVSPPAATTAQPQQKQQQDHHPQNQQPHQPQLHHTASAASLSSTSTSSFRPQIPLRPSTRLQTSLRTPPPPPSLRGSMRSLRAPGAGHLRTHSRFSTDSDLPVVVGTGTLDKPGGAYSGCISRERAGSEATVKRRRRGRFWRFLKGRERGGVDVGVGMVGEKEKEVGMMETGGKKRRWWRGRGLWGR